MELFPKDGFKVTIPIFKAYEENGDIYVMGLGGDTEPDDHGERLTEECIADMKLQVQEGHIAMIRGHWNAAGQVITTGEWDDELGQVVDIIITPQGQMFPKILMDMEMPLSRSLVKKIQMGKKLGLSYGGKVEQHHEEFTPDGRTIKVFDKIKLWHFVPTTKPVYSRNLNQPLEIVAKSISSDEWARANRVEVSDSINFHTYERREEVLAIYKSVREDGNMNGGDKLAAKWFQGHGAATEGTLTDSDFGWLSFEYQKMSAEERDKADKSKHRKLPFKVHGVVYEDGWRAAWNAVNGARGGMDFSGGPSQEVVVRKLLSSKPKEVTVTKSENGQFCVEGVMLSEIENPEALEVLRSVEPDIFETEDKQMDMTMDMLKEIIGMNVDKMLDAKLKSHSDETDKKILAITAGIGEIKEALKSKKDAAGDDAVLKAEDVKKLALEAMKDSMGELAKAALKAKPDAGSGEDKKDPEEQFRADVVAICKGEKTFEDFENGDDKHALKYVAKLKSEAERVSAEVFYNICGTDPGKVETILK
jgi:hypothetical protein